MHIYTILILISCPSFGCLNSGGKGKGWKPRQGQKKNMLEKCKDNGVSDTDDNDPLANLWKKSKKKQKSE